MKNILITGITGQDGIFLTKLLINKYKKIHIVGTTRSYKSEARFLRNLDYLGVEKNKLTKLDILKTNLNDYEKVSQFIKEFRPDYVYNFSGPSSVYESLKNPLMEIEIQKIFDNLTNSLIANKNFCKFYQASSSEMFKSSNNKLDENSPFYPTTPYSRAKLINHYKTIELRAKYNWEIYSGITFNHESEFRKDEYLIMKIIHNAISISNKNLKNFELGSTDLIRDWSYAEDIVIGINKICENGISGAYVIGRGIGNKISDILDIVFNFFNLDWKKYVIINDSLLRENSPHEIISNPKKIQNELGWRAKTDFENMLIKIVNYKTKFYLE